MGRREVATQAASKTAEEDNDQKGWNKTEFDNIYT